MSDPIRAELGAAVSPSQPSRRCPPPWVPEEAAIADALSHGVDELLAIAEVSRGREGVLLCALRDSLEQLQEALRFAYHPDWAPTVGFRVVVEGSAFFAILREQWPVLVQSSNASPLMEAVTSIRAEDAFEAILRAGRGLLERVIAEYTIYLKVERDRLSSIHRRDNAALALALAQVVVALRVGQTADLRASPLGATSGLDPGRCVVAQPRLCHAPPAVRRACPSGQTWSGLAA